MSKFPPEFSCHKVYSSSGVVFTRPPHHHHAVSALSPRFSLITRRHCRQPSAPAQTPPPHTGALGRLCRATRTPSACGLLLDSTDMASSKRAGRTPQFSKDGAAGRAACELSSRVRSAKEIGRRSRGGRVMPSLAARGYPGPCARRSGRQTPATPRWRRSFASLLWQNLVYTFRLQFYAGLHRCEQSRWMHSGEASLLPTGAPGRM